MLERRLEKLQTLVSKHEKFTQMKREQQAAYLHTTDKSECQLDILQAQAEAIKTAEEAVEAKHQQEHEAKHVAATAKGVWTVPFHKTTGLFGTHAMSFNVAMHDVALHGLLQICTVAGYLSSLLLYMHRLCKHHDGCLVCCATGCLSGAYLV